MDKESPNSAVFSRYTLENALYLQRKVDILSEGIVTEAELFELLVCIILLNYLKGFQTLSNDEEVP